MKLRPQQVSIDLAREAHAHLCRESLIKFVEVSNPNYETEEFHRQLAADLEWAYNEMSEGRPARLMIFAPPQHGKSEIASRAFPAWVLGKDPSLKVISASWGFDLAVGMSRDVQRVMSLPQYSTIFPKTVLPNTRAVTMADRPKRTADLFELVGARGGYKTIGAGGGISGFPADLIVIDDPFANRQDANSKVRRDVIFNWYSYDMLTRTSKNASVIIVNTRWNVDDLCGRLLESEGDLKNGGKWKVSSHEAVATKDYSFRKEGEALCPIRKPLSHLAQFMGNPVEWAALYQQNPVIAGGNLIKDEYLNWYSEKELPRCDYRIIVADTAMKAKESNDYSVFQCWGFSRALNRAYLIDQKRGKFLVPDLPDIAKAFAAKQKGDFNHGALRAFHIEDKSSGTGLIQYLERDTDLPVKGIQRRPGEDKEFRVNDVLSYFCHVFLPNDKTWSNDLHTELTQFPNGVNDDQVDPLADALAILFLSGQNKEVKLEWV